MVQNVNPFQMIEPYGDRQEGDFGIYSVPADTPEPDDPKEIAPPAEVSEGLAPPVETSSVPVPVTPPPPPL